LGQAAVFVEYTRATEVLGPDRFFSAFSLRGPYDALHEIYQLHTRRHLAQAARDPVILLIPRTTGLHQSTDRIETSNSGRVDSPPANLRRAAGF
jgi:hypothetical protein